MKTKTSFRKTISTCLGSVALFFALVIPAQARTIFWSGLTWDVRVGSNLFPGPNDWSDSTNNVWIDTNGYLHLTIVQSNGSWFASEISSQDTLGYGEYRFVVDNRVDLIDTNMVAGLFMFRDNSNEIDIEFTRAFTTQGTNNALFATQPADTPGNQSPYFLDLSSGQPSSHRFTWTPADIVYQSYLGESAPPPDPADILGSFNYRGADIPTLSTQKVHINTWLFEGMDPTDTGAVELVLRSFSFISKPADLFDFEAGIDGWSPFGGGSPTVAVASPAQANSGTGALQCTHDQTVAFDGLFKTNVPINDWSAFNTLSYSIKSSLPGNTNEVQIEILESSGELWKQRVRTVVTNTYQRVDLDLEGFVDTGFDVSAGGDDFALSVTNIREMNFVFFPQNVGPASPISYFIDDIALSSNAPGDSSLGVAPAAVAFGSLAAAEGATRFTSSPVTASYSAASSGWRLEVATDNALDFNGLVATDGGNAGIPLKVWTADFGEGVASNVPPNPNDDLNWTGGTPVYKFVLDVDVQGTGSNSTLAVDGLHPDVADIPFYFGLDTAGAVVTTYTGSITLDLVFP